MGLTPLTSENYGEFLKIYKCEPQFPGNSNPALFEPEFLMDLIFSPS